MVSESIENINFASKVKVKVKSLSCIGLFATLWTVARQAPQSMGFSRQEYWIGLPFPSPEDLLGPGICFNLLGEYLKNLVLGLVLTNMDFKLEMARFFKTLQAKIRTHK